MHVEWERCHYPPRNSAATEIRIFIPDCGVCRFFDESFREPDRKRIPPRFQVLYFTATQGFARAMSTV
jgi:hypothetical protein